MNLIISGHHLEVTPALRSYVTEKLDRITRHFDQVVDVKVLLSVEKLKEKERRQRAECNIHVKGGDMFAQSANADLYAAVDDLVDKLDRQVVRHKDRIQDHHHEAPKRVMKLLALCPRRKNRQHFGGFFVCIIRSTYEPPRVTTTAAACTRAGRCHQ